MQINANRAISVVKRWSYTSSPSWASKCKRHSYAPRALCSSSSCHSCVSWVSPYRNNQSKFAVPKYVFQAMIPELRKFGGNTSRVPFKTNVNRRWILPMLMPTPGLHILLASRVWLSHSSGETSSASQWDKSLANRRLSLRALLCQFSCEGSGISLGG